MKEKFNTSAPSGQMEAPIRLAGILPSALAADRGKPYNNGTPCLHIQMI